MLHVGAGEAFGVVVALLGDEVAEQGGEASSPDTPDAWRRHLAFVLDGLRPRTH